MSSLVSSQWETFLAWTASPCRQDLLERATGVSLATDFSMPECHGQEWEGDTQLVGNKPSSHVEFRKTGDNWDVLSAANRSTFS